MMIKFVASLPDIQSAISVGGDGARIKLDVPESELGNVIRLVLLKGQTFEVVIDDGEREVKPKRK